MKTIKKRMGEFCGVIDERNKQGIPIGLSELTDLAMEMGTPIPTFNENFELVWNDEDFKEKK